MSISLESEYQFDAARAACGTVRIRNAGLSTIPTISEDHRYCFADASRTILRTEG